MTEDDSQKFNRDIEPHPSRAVRDYEQVLRGVIEQIEDDPSRLRAFVYDLARVHLKREAFNSYRSLGRTGVERHLAELERAIEQVEAKAQTPTLFGPTSGLVNSSERPASGVVTIYEPPRWLDRRSDVSLIPAEYETRLPRERPTSRISLALQFIGTAAIGVLLSAILTGQITFDRLWRPKIEAQVAPVSVTDTASQKLDQSQLPLSPAAASQPPYPLPTTYGVYVVSEDRLYELERLQLRVPDQRVQLSAEINSPSVTTVSGGNLVFVIFLRELVNNAPRRVQVRVVARVAREMTFKGGTASTASIDGGWRIRSNYHEFKVSPVDGRNEMIAIQPDTGFVFPPGRYVLALNGVGYDFAVTGAPPSPAHCLERFETATGLIYGECQRPPQ
jgi:hypothetical protein